MQPHAPVRPAAQRPGPSGVDPDPKRRLGISRVPAKARGGCRVPLSHLSVLPDRHDAVALGGHVVDRAAPAGDGHALHSADDERPFGRCVKRSEDKALVGPARDKARRAFCARGAELERGDRGRVLVKGAAMRGKTDPSAHLDRGTRAAMGRECVGRHRTRA